MFVGYMRDTDPQMTPLPVGVPHPPWSLERIYMTRILPLLGHLVLPEVWCVLWPGYPTRARVSREGYGGNDPTPVLCRRPVHARSNVNHIVQL